MHTDVTEVLGHIPCRETCKQLMGKSNLQSSFCQMHFTYNSTYVTDGSLKNLTAESGSQLNNHQHHQQQMFIEQT